MAGEGKIIGQDIVDQSAHDAVILLTKESDELLKKFVELAGGITTFRTALGNVKGYDDVTKAIAGQKTQLTELDKIKNQIKATDEKVRASMTLEAQILARVRQELREVNKETADFIKSNKMQEGSLDQLRATLNRLNKEYSALGAAERDAAKGKDLINKLQETRDKVYSLETSMGNWTRNVGNYKSGFSAIGNSVAQISREMPAFANSLNTGFMAISNNLPALSDAIKGIREQNKLLAAEGKPTESVLKQLGSAVFSWNTLLSVGVTLLTVYGGKIWDYITGNENAAKSTKRTKENG
jgi:chromosome segregation ATPase